MSQSFKTFKAGAICALLALAAAGAAVQAQPSFGNPSPTAGSSTSDKANSAADAAAYQEVEYTNKNKRGPALIVIPGEIKSNNASFTQRFLPNNIADFAELELSQANFPVLERTNLGPLVNEISLAYNLGDPQAARKTMQMGKLKTTKWILKFDILKAEQIAENKKGFDGRAVGSLLSIFGGGSMAGSAAGTVAGSVQTGDATGVWLIGRHGDRLCAYCRSDRHLDYWYALQDHGCQHHRAGGPGLQGPEDGSGRHLNQRDGGV